MIATPVVNPARFVQFVVGNFKLALSFTTNFPTSQTTCRIAPTPIAKNTVASTGLKAKPPIHVPKIAGDPAMIAIVTKCRHPGF